MQLSSKQLYTTGLLLIHLSGCSNRLSKEDEEKLGDAAISQAIVFSAGTKTCLDVRSKEACNFAKSSGELAIKLLEPLCANDPSQYCKPLDSARLAVKALEAKLIELRV